jgi:hypothetical protein
MNLKKYMESRIHGWLPEENSLPSSQTGNMFNLLKNLELVRLAYSVILGYLLVTPFGVYHSISEPYITGYLWGYDLPIGYIGLLLGIVIALYPRLNAFRRLKFSSLIPLIGLFLLLFTYFSPNYCFINLLRGTSFSSFQIDIDFQIGNSAVVWLSLLSIIFGLVSVALRHWYFGKQASDLSKELKT